MRLDHTLGEDLIFVLSLCLIGWFKCPSFPVIYFESFEADETPYIMIKSFIFFCLMSFLWKRIFFTSFLCEYAETTRCACFTITLFSSSYLFCWGQYLRWPVRVPLVRGMRRAREDVCHSLVGGFWRSQCLWFS